MDNVRAVLGVLLLGPCITWLSCEVSAEQIFGGGVINLRHRHNTWEPLMQTKANLSEVKSIRSIFEFRTLDPEGTIFYGDTREGKDWFVLLLRGGIPEMQIGKADVLASAMGGPKLNDGLWHKLELRSEGKFVVLEVDDEVALVVGLDAKTAQIMMTGQIRLALGGILVDKEKLVHQFTPAMDGCIREGHWLNLSTPWDTDPNRETWPCFSEIKRGSYFSGQGMVMFNTSELPSVQSEEQGIIIEIFGYWRGTIFSFQRPGFRYTTVDSQPSNNSKEGSINDILGFPNSPKLVIKILRHSWTVNGITQSEDESQDFYSYWREGMILAFGGLPGESEELGRSQYLHGCLERILIQGQDIDLDQAFYKHSSVSSHSCPVKVVDGVPQTL
ncbi:sex hormone-binding globulin [Chanos chanos]|uniref:Sex hormone-binding globulin n=1 Tax=Chanos chanos TaxID=29144 RepID=A0A6J2VIP8_CHACN|nr:sex hormone-binding globulin-like [Chanos chanos]